MFCIAKVGRAKVGRAKVGRAKVGRAKVGRAKVGRAKVGRAKVGRAKVGIDKVGRAKVGRAKVGIDKVGRAKVGIDKVGIDKVGRAKVGIDKVGRAKVGRAKVGRAKVGRAKVGRAKVGRAKVGSFSTFFSFDPLLVLFEDEFQFFRVHCFPLFSLLDYAAVYDGVAVALGLFSRRLVVPLVDLAKATAELAYHDFYDFVSALGLDLQQDVFDRRSKAKRAVKCAHYSASMVFANSAILIQVSFFPSPAAA